MENKKNRGREFSPDYKKSSPNDDRSARRESGTGSNRDGSFKERSPQRRFNPENREGGGNGGFRRDRGEGFKPRESGDGGFRRDRGEGFKPREGGGNGGFRRDRGEGFKPRESGDGGFRRDRGEGFKPREGGGNGGFRRDRGEGFKPREGGDGGFRRDRSEGFENREGGGNGSFRRDRGDGFKPREGGDGGFRRDRGEGFKPREGGGNGGFRRDRGEGFKSNEGRDFSKKKISIREDASERVDSMEKKEKRELFQSLEERKTPFFEKQPRVSDDEEDSLDKPIRINRFLAKCGLGARRNVEEFIKKGRVSINGEVISAFSTKVNPLEDKITFDGEEIQLLPDSMILAFNKPFGYLCSHHDVHHEKTIFNLLPAKYRKFNMAGRLDLTSRGLMILSPNGDLLNNVTHPSSGLEKEYIVKVESIPTETQLVESFLHGIDDSGEFLRAKEVEVLDSTEGLVRIVLKEGKKRQIHRMFQFLGSSVLDLQRVRIGNLKLKDLHLEEGSFKEIQEEEIFGE
jgi:23S rRNA pseudouridine2605 synthase